MTGRNCPRRMHNLPCEYTGVQIKAYFDEHDGEFLYPSDVSAALNLDYDLVSEVIERLASEGQVAKTEV